MAPPRCPACGAEIPGGMNTCPSCPVEAFIARFLPPGVGDPHGLLFDFHQRHDFVPTPIELRACLDAYAALVKSVTAREPVGVLGLHDASELVLTYVARAHRRDRGSVARAATAATEATLREALEGVRNFAGGYFVGFDAQKRVASIVELIAESRGAGPTG